MQLCFVSHKGTTDVIFRVSQLQEKKKQLYFVVINVEQAFDRVTWEVVGGHLRTLSLHEWLL